SIRNAYRASRFGINELIQSANIVGTSSYASFGTKGRAHRRTECILATVATNQVSPPDRRSWHGKQHSSVRFRSRVGGPLPISSGYRSAIVQRIAARAVLALHAVAVIGWLAHPIPVLCELYHAGCPTLRGV